MQNPDALVPAARDTRSARRRTVLVLVCAVVALCVVIALWPASEPAAPSSPPAAVRDVGVATAAIAGDVSAPQRHAASATNEERDSRLPDDPTLLRIVFDSFEPWVAGRPVTWVHFGPADGSAREIIAAPINARIHGPSHEWLIHDGHLRRVRGDGATLRIPLGDYVPASEQRDAFDPLRNEIERPGWSSRSALANAVFREHPDARESGGFVVLQDLRARVDTPTFRLSCVVRSPGGIAVGDCMIEIAAATNGEKVDASKLRAGTYRVRAASKRGGRAECVVNVNADTTIELVLRRGADVRGRVVDRDGNGVEHARLIWSAPGEYRNHAMTSSNGKFALLDVGAAGSLWACVPGRTSQLPAAGRVVAPGEEVELVIDKERCRGSLQVRVAVPDGVRAGDVSVRLWQQESGLGVRLFAREPGEHTVVFVRDEIPAGHYRLEAYCPRFGAIDAGTFWLDGTGRVERDIALPQPAHITFALSDARGPDAFELVRVGAAVDILIPSEQPFAGPHLLGPGRYAVWWRDKSGARSQEFSVTASGPQTIELHD